MHFKVATILLAATALALPTAIPDGLALETPIEKVSVDSLTPNRVAELAPADSNQRGPRGGGFFGNPLGGIVGGIANGVGGAIGSAVGNTIGNTIGNAWGNVANGFGNVASGVIDGLRDTFWGRDDDDDRYGNRGPYRGNNGPYNNGPYNNGPYNNGPYNNGPYNNGPYYGNQGGWRTVDVPKEAGKEVNPVAAPN